MVIVSGAAAASEVSSHELRDLARRAETDPSALQRLRDVDEVDGAPVDLEAALGGASGGELRARLSALGQDGSSSAPRAGTAQAAARSITSQRRFREPVLPRPLEGLLTAIGAALAPLWRVLVRIYLAVAQRVPGGRATVWVILSAVVVALAAAVAGRTARRIGRGGVAPGETAAGPTRLDPSGVERLAESAERSGDLERAVRLRFRAGLMRLGQAGVIRWRPSLTSGEVARSVRSPTFERLAAQFDEIAYGGRPASPDDVASARAGWRLVGREATEGRR
ncbi:MAG: DUF4129 domain-containing protein [Actinobacteria bacterium]|nr:DUF4129 domain-containing protein [Actinomycetota bacterium]